MSFCCNYYLSLKSLVDVEIKKCWWWVLMLSIVVIVVIVVVKATVFHIDLITDDLLSEFDQIYFLSWQNFH